MLNARRRIVWGKGRPLFQENKTSSTLKCSLCITGKNHIIRPWLTRGIKEEGGWSGGWLNLATESSKLWACKLWYPTPAKWQAGVREDFLELLNWIMEKWMGILGAQ